MKDGLAGSKDDFFLPSIHDSDQQGRVVKTKHGATRKSKSTDETLLPSSRMFSNGKKLYSSAPTSESSTPFKLPSIQRSKSISVSNLATDGKAARFNASTSSRAELTRSPSCPLLIDIKEDCVNGDDPGSQLTNRSSNSKKTWTGGISESFHLKLPNIFHQRDFKSLGSSSSLTPRTINNEKEQTMIDSPRNTRRHVISKSDKNEQVRSQQSFALLLPLTTSTKTTTRKSEGMRKTKKRKSTRDGIEAPGLTSILKDKLLAIEARESADSSSLVEEEERIVDIFNDASIEVMK